MSINNFRVVRFYTNKAQPLLTSKPISFLLEYQNNSSRDTSVVPAEIHLGDRIQKVNLPGIKANTTQRITLQLTNNISEELDKIGVRISVNDSSEAFKTYTWKGVLDINIGEVYLDGGSDQIQTDDEIYSQYKVQIDNVGTKRARSVECEIFVDNKKVGTVNIPEIAPRRRVTVQFPIQRKAGTASCAFKVKENGILVDNKIVNVVVSKISNDAQVVSFTPQKITFSMNEPGKLDLVVRNNGEHGIANLKTAINLVDVDTGKVLSRIGTFRFSGVLSPGSSATKIIQINNANKEREIGLKVSVGYDDKINDTNSSNNEKYALLKFTGASGTDHSGCAKYDKAKKIRMYKFYADPARIPGTGFDHDESKYLIGEINLTSTEHGYLVSLGDYASLAGGSVSGSSITRYGHTLEFVNDSVNFKVVNGNFKTAFNFGAKSTVPALEVNGKMYVEPETLARALGSNLVEYSADVLEVYDPHFHTICSASIKPSVIGNEKPQPSKIIFVGGPWITGWNSSDMRALKLSDNFTMGEFQCGGIKNGTETCRCGHTIIVAKCMLDEWQRVREGLGVSFTVTSGYRCVLHNRGLGASKGSRHQFGDAADMVSSKGYAMMKSTILQNHCDLANSSDGRTANKGDFNGVAASSKKNFVHADTRSYASNWNY